MKSTKNCEELGIITFEKAKEDMIMGIDICLGGDIMRMVKS